MKVAQLCTIFGRKSMKNQIVIQQNFISIISVSTTATTNEMEIIFPLALTLRKMESILSASPSSDRIPRIMLDSSHSQSKSQQRTTKYFATSPDFLSCSTVEVLATLTGDVGRIMSKMHLVQPNGNVNLITGIRIAHVSSNNLKIATLLTFLDLF